MLRLKARYADVTATLALTVALATGGAYAADRIGTPDIRRGAVTSPKIKNRTIATKDIRQGAIKQTRIAPRSVRASKIVEQGITRELIRPGAIGCVELAPQIAAELNSC